MPSPINHEKPALRAAMLGLFVACALAISLIERMIPPFIPLPGVRLGLANAAVLLAVYLFPAGLALRVALAKCLLAAIFAGSPSALFYSLGGTLPSFAAMAALSRLPGSTISPVGVSVVGAALHNTGQIAVACLLFKSWTPLWYLPPLLLLCIATGAAIGLLVSRLRLYLAAVLHGKHTPD